MKVERFFFPPEKCSVFHIILTFLSGTLTTDASRMCVHTHIHTSTQKKAHTLAGGFRERRITHSRLMRWNESDPTYQRSQAMFCQNFLISCLEFSQLLKISRLTWCLFMSVKRGGTLDVWSCRLLSLLTSWLFLCVTDVMSYGFFVWHLQSGKTQWHFLISSALSSANTIIIDSNCLCDKNLQKDVYCWPLRGNK